MTDVTGAPTDWCVARVLGERDRVGNWSGPAEDPKTGKDSHMVELADGESLFVSGAEFRLLTEDGEIAEAKARFVVEAVAADEGFNPNQRLMALETLRAPFGTPVSKADAVAFAEALLRHAPDGLDGCVGPGILPWSEVFNLARDVTEAGIPVPSMR